MRLKQTILEYVPIVAGTAAAVTLLGSGVAAEISDIVANGMESIKPVVEAGETAVAFLGMYYIAKKQCEYFAADANYTPDN